MPIAKLKLVCVISETMYEMTEAGCSLNSSKYRLVTPIVLGAKIHTIESKSKEKRPKNKARSMKPSTYSYRQGISWGM